MKGLLKPMKKLVLLIAVVFIVTLPLIACTSKYKDDDAVYTNAINTDDEKNIVEENEAEIITEEEIVGIYTEPLTGAHITIPEGLIYKAKKYGQYGVGVIFSDQESYPTLSLSIMIDEIYVDRIDEAYEKLGFNSSFSESELQAYAENYIKVFTKSDFFDDINYSYDWVCLLTDGSVLHVTLTAKNSNPTMILPNFSIDFNDSGYELGLVSIYNLISNEGNIPIAGIWENSESGYWFDCSGGLLFSIHDKEGALVDCGIYDSLFESLEGGNQSYYVGLDDNLLTIEGFNGYFYQKPKLEVIPNDIPAGIACEGTKAGEPSDEKIAEYLGQWENDTISCSIEINRGGINIYEDHDYSNASYKLVDDGNMKLIDQRIIKLNDDGGLTLEGCEGVFYRADKIKSSYSLYLGHWYNKTASQSFYLQDGGVYGYPSGESGFGVSTWSVKGKGILQIGDNKAYIDDNGNLVIDGYNDVFVLQDQ